MNAPEQTRALARAFLLRFFDNEITSGTNDLKSSFFNLIAFLATPGILYPVAMSMSWALIVKIRGVDVFRMFSWHDKAVYLGLSMVATGLVAAVVWSSLLVDRRDGLVLGVLPVRSRVIVQAKLLAVAAYVGLIAIGMHVAGSIPFGFLLASGNTLGFALRGMFAHFVAATAASLFVFATVVAIQGVWLAALGPRVFARASAWLQLALVAVVLLGLLFMPDITDRTVSTIIVTPRAQPWILSTPPLWFLGLYEVLLGTNHPTLLMLGRTALLALAVAVSVAALSYPLAYRRVMRDAVEHPGGIGRVGVLTAPARWLTAVLARNGATRATLQFFLSTLGRVERHRFTLALAGGAVLAWSLPTLVQWRELVDSQKILPLLALLLSTMTFLLVGLRVASALPSDLRAGWIFEAANLPRGRVRAGARRVLLALGVVPVVVVAVVVYWRLFGVELAIKHGLVCLVGGLLVTEYLLRKADGMPCDQPWRPEAANLRVWFAAYFMAFILFASSSHHALAAWALASYGGRRSYALLVGALLVAALTLRLTSPRQPPVEQGAADGLNAAEVLDLN